MPGQSREDRKHIFTPVIFGILSLLFAGALSACGSPPVAPPPTTLVEMGHPKPGKIKETGEYIATLKSRQSIEIRPQVQGEITKITVKSGDHVPAGQLLIQIRPDEQQALVQSNLAAQESAKAELQTAKSQLEALSAQEQSAQSDLNLKQQQYTRYEGLFQDKAISPSELEQYTDALNQSKASLARAKAQVSSQQAVIAKSLKAITSAQANTRQEVAKLRYYAISAPFSGIIGDIPVKVGDYVNPVTVLANLTQPGPLEIYIPIPRELSGRLQAGLPIELLDSENQVVEEGVVSFISPRADESTQSLLVKGVVKNPSGRFRSQELYKTRIVWNSTPGYLIPTTAVMKISGQDFVFVARRDNRKQSKDNNGQTLKAFQIPVKLGVIQGNDYPVISGLKPNDLLVTSGIQKLKDGAAVKAKSAQAK